MLYSKPDENELAGLERLLKWLEPKTCRDVTGQTCGAILSDECDACIELEAAANLIRGIVERFKPPAPWTIEQKAALAEAFEVLQKAFPPIPKKEVPGEVR